MCLKFAAALSPETTKTATAKFSTYQANIADSTIPTVAASSSAVAGSYSLEVTALATAQRQALGSTYDATASAIDFGGNATRTLTLTKGSGASASAVGITLDSTKTTLGDLRDAINKAAAGVSAVIVTGADNKQNLLLTATDTGTTNAVTLSGNANFIDPVGGAAIAASSAFSTTEAATDAAAKINGIAVSASGNTLTTAVDGLTINLLKTNTGSPTTITLTRDTGTLKSAPYTFIKNYNDLNKYVLAGWLRRHHHERRSTQWRLDAALRQESGPRLLLWLGLVVVVPWSDLSLFAAHSIVQSALAGGVPIWLIFRAAPRSAPGT